MASKLGIYNEALGHLEERRITSLSEAREPRRVLDDYWDSNLGYCLEQGFWNFAMRAVQVDSSTSVTPTFGYSYAFAKPSDWVRTFLVASDEDQRSPLLDYKDEPNYWYAEFDPLYISYVSKDAAYGLDLSIWPETFANYVALRLAKQACIRITSSASMKNELMVYEKRALADARSKDAMNEPPGFAPRGSWVRSRGGGYYNRSRWDGSFR